MKRTRRGHMGLGALVVLGFLFGGCGGDEQPERIQYPWEQGSQGESDSTSGAGDANDGEPAIESVEGTQNEADQGAAGSAPEAFVTSSTVVFPGLEAQPHAWRCVYQGADRVRWELSLPGDASGRRQIEYRFGAEGFLLPSGLKASVALGQLERERLFRGMALRQAVFSDGAGAAWTRRDLPGDLGYIERTAPAASPDGAGDARGYAAFDAAGKQRERLEVGAWQTLEGITWPRELTLQADGNTVWSETVDAVQTRSWYAENYFRPPDRKLP